jgi:hypothetical protein
MQVLAHPRGSVLGRVLAGTLVGADVSMLERWIARASVLGAA